MRALRPVALLLALVLLWLAGCTGNTQTNTVAPQPLDTGQAPASGTAASTTTPNPAGGLTTRPPGADHAVTIQGFRFSPQQVNITAGDSVTWTNQDGADHTATSTDHEGFDSGTLHNGNSFTQRFPTAGTYHYHCAIHSSMTATIVVQ